MSNRVVTSFLLTFVLNLIVVFVRSSEFCPTYCVCDTWYKLQRASCNGRHLYSIHTGAPTSVQALDLSNNSISSLSNFELANAGLTRLKYLNLSGNSISEIGLNAFSGLTDLTILDLSRNHLYYVLADVFSENKNLRILKLSKNNFNSHVPKLRSSSLTELRLDSCQISHLPLDTFNGMTSIASLDLSNNLMIEIDSAVLRVLRFLNKLSLDGNPWSCNNVMYDLLSFLKDRSVEFNTVCGKAAGLKKFEKMILGPVTKVENYHHTAVINKSIEKVKNISQSNLTHVSDDKNASTWDNTTNHKTNFVNSMNDELPYWFLAIGFILGSASGIAFSYIWLTGSFTCCRKCSRRERTNDDSQRLSLLLNLWQFEELLLSDNVNLVASCPGTPPPPYREVMLRPGLYRCPSTSSNLNDNNTGCRERYT